ncbi:MAG: histidine phosphatase family protein [Bacilli bacterium]|nr:histidine phosphatase family protein [Bacilli bacterium]
MKLYVVRHGQTLANIEKTVSGDKESPLTSEGINQAKKLAEELKDINFDIVFSSPLLRAIDTARLITKKTIHIDERLIERDYGLNEGKLIENTNPDELWDYNLNTDKYQNEKVKDLMERIEDFINFLKENYNEKTVLVVTHSGVSRAIYYTQNKIPRDGILKNLELTNCGYQEYDL